MNTGKWVSKYKLTIMGKPWVAYFKTGEQYEKVLGAGSRAMTLCRAREIHFNCSEAFVKDNVAVHELTHAYLFEMGFNDIVYTTENQREETFCVLNEMRGEDIIKQARPLTRIYNKLGRQLRKKAMKENVKKEDDYE